MTLGKYLFDKSAFQISIGVCLKYFLFVYIFRVSVFVDHSFFCFSCSYENGDGWLVREWSDVSPACLCLTPRIFPLNFLDVRIYHRLQSSEKTYPVHRASDSYYDCLRFRETRRVTWISHFLSARKKTFAIPIVDMNF